MARTSVRLGFLVFCALGLVFAGSANAIGTRKTIAEDAAAKGKGKEPAPSPSPSPKPRQRGPAKPQAQTDIERRLRKQLQVLAPRELLGVNQTLAANNMYAAGPSAPGHLNNVPGIDRLMDRGVTAVAT